LQPHKSEYAGGFHQIMAIYAEVVSGEGGTMDGIEALEKARDAIVKEMTSLYLKYCGPVAIILDAGLPPTRRPIRDRRERR